MRTPPGDGADQQSTRPRDGAAAAGSSVFAPGYGASRRGTDRAPGTGPSSGPGSPDSSQWYGSAAGGAAGKGPVRGYPPVPGQPPPMYPPGQFAAWNRGRRGQAIPPASSGLADRAQPPTGRSDSGPAAWQSPPTAGAGTGTSRYYERPDGPETDPGYSMLAVSDPAADVTSTQTWHALGDGRATGVWTAPARPGAGPSRPGMPPARPSADSGAPDGAAGGRRGTESAAAATASALPARPDTTRADGPRTRARAHSGARTGPQDAPRTDGASRSRSQRASGRTSHGKRPASVKLAVTVAILFVVVAAATLGYVVLRSSAKPRPAAGPPPKVTPSATPSPTPGPYGRIASRAADPQPLTVAQLFPLTFTLGGQPVARTATAVSKRCAGALQGSNIQSAVGGAGCNQVVRATYLAKSAGLMGTIGVLNLSTAKGAVRAIRSTDASDFISQLKGRRGPTRRIGSGTGIEVAAAKGHYLILIWAEFTSMRKPRTAAQRTAIENFMTGLRDNTANVSLSNRLLNGTP
jgi:hypothetical protein